MGYSKGSRLKTFEQFIDRCESGLPFYYINKFMAAGVVAHWTVAKIKKAIRDGDLYAAHKKNGHTTATEAMMRRISPDIGDCIRYAWAGLDRVTIIPEYLQGAKKDQTEKDLLTREFQRRLNAHYDNMLLTALTIPFPPNQFTCPIYKGEPMDQDRLKKGNALLKQIEAKKNKLEYLQKTVKNGHHSFNLSGNYGSVKIINIDDDPEAMEFFIAMAISRIEKELSQLEKEFEAL